MVSRIGFITILLTLCSFLLVYATVEANQSDASQITEEMVCSATEGEKSCKSVLADELVGTSSDQENDGFDNDSDDDAEEEPDEEYDEDDDDEDDDDEFIERVDDDEECVNKSRDCQHWANLNPSECETNPNYMLLDCKLACRACKRHKRYSDILPSPDGKDIGEPQSFEGDRNVSDEDIEERIAASQKYMNRQIQMGTVDPELLRTCRNTDERCTYWSLIGECENNPAYMKLSCGPACYSCDMLSIEKRCPMDRETIGPDVWSPGDLGKMFRRLSSEPYKSKYDVKVLSSPDNENEGPWAITMDNFISDEEADRLIELGAAEGYERSTDVGEMRVDGTSASKVSKGRTSHNAWCSNECINDELVVAVNNRISNMTKIPILNSEDLQLLRYGPGQKYETHHDYIEYEIDRQGGVRIITVYMYLNDVDAGGGTNFPKLDITVMPKRGRVLIWPSVLDSDPNKIDDRTDHQALPVEAGMKYGANAWFHMRNFKGPNDSGC